MAATGALWRTSAILMLTITSVGKTEHLALRAISHGPGGTLGSGPKDILLECFDSFSQVYGGSSPHSPTIYRLNMFKSLTIFHQKEFVEICLPLYRQYSACREKRYLTLCVGLVVFLHTVACQRPSDEDKYFVHLWTKSLLMEKYECFSHICDGLYRVIVYNVSGVAVQLFRLDKGAEGEQCVSLYKQQELANVKDKLVLTFNMFYPSCYAMYHVNWLADPEERGLNRFWDYLPYSCQVGEISLVAFVTLIGVTGTLGNMLVVVVMLSGDHREESSILRTSLAFADLFTSIFVVIPAVVDHLIPILGLLDVGENSATMTRSRETLSVTTKAYHHLVSVTHGYRLFQGMVFGVCSLVSLFTVFLLSVERLVVTGRSLRYKHYFTILRIKLAIFLSWTIALTFTLLFMYDGEGTFGVTWSTMLKLPISTTRTKTGKVVQLIYAFLILLLAIVCLSTAAISFLSIVTFVKEQARVLAEWKRLDMRVVGPFHQENRHILVTLSILSILFLMSTVPIGLWIVITLAKHFYASEDLYRYLGYWLFLSGCSLNPWLYNMRSEQFRKEAADVLKGMVPLWLRKMLKKPHSEAKKEREAAQKRMMKKLDLL